MIDFKLYHFFLPSGYAPLLYVCRVIKRKTCLWTPVDSMFGVSMPDKDEAHCSCNNKNKFLVPTLLSTFSSGSQKVLGPVIWFLPHFCIIYILLSNVRNILCWTLKNNQSINQSYLLVSYCFLQYIYYSTLKFLQAVCQSIKPNIEQGAVGAYLLEHIDLDLTSIQNVLGKNKDDVLILIHFLLAQIMNRHSMAVIGKHQIIR